MHLSGRQRRQTFLKVFRSILIPVSFLFYTELLNTFSKKNVKVHSRLLLAINKPGNEQNHFHVTIRALALSMEIERPPVYV